jgi:hypothetical protein
MDEAGTDLSTIMVEVPLADGSGNVPVQLLWSNAIGAPQGPVDHPLPAAGAAADRPGALRARPPKPIAGSEVHLTPYRGCSGCNSPTTPAHLKCLVATFRCLSASKG